MRFVVREVMVREGYEVEEAVNGEEAVQKVREQHFDLIVMDVKMPVIDGIEALRQIKRIRPSLVILFLELGDACGFQALSMLKLDEATRDIRILTSTVVPEDTDVEPEEGDEEAAQEETLFAALAPVRLN